MTTICSLAVIAASLLIVPFISFSTAQVLVCDQPPDPGLCKWRTHRHTQYYMRRYYYDQKTGTCNSFLYEGCGGNENNFDTKEKCEATCMPVKGASPMWDYFWMSSLDDEHMFS